MAAIGIAWAADAWVEAGWVTGGSPAWAAVSAPATIIRRGGRFLVEVDPEIREEKTQELKELIKPKITAKSPAREPQEPQESLLTIVSTATSRMTLPQQMRLDRLLQETGISMDELLVLLQ